MVQANVYDFKIRNIKGYTFKLERYEGKVILIVNTASYGKDSAKVVGQMNDMQAKFSDELAILAFPCNQFDHGVSIT